MKFGNEHLYQLSQFCQTMSEVLMSYFVCQRRAMKQQEGKEPHVLSTHCIPGRMLTPPLTHYLIYLHSKPAHRASLPLHTSNQGFRTSARLHTIQSCFSLDGFRVRLLSIKWARYHSVSRQAGGY